MRIRLWKKNKILRRNCLSITPLMKMKREVKIAIILMKMIVMSMMRTAKKMMMKMMKIKKIINKMKIAKKM